MEQLYYVKITNISENGKISEFFPGYEDNYTVTLNCNCTRTQLFQFFEDRGIKNSERWYFNGTRVYYIFSLKKGAIVRTKYRSEINNFDQLKPFNYLEFYPNTNINIF